MNLKIPPLIALLAFYALANTATVLAPPPVSSADRAAAYLKSHQFSNGTYGAYLEHWAASAAYGLYLYEGNSTNVTTPLTTLKSVMENKSWWFWDPSFGEADIPGLILYTFAATHHLSSLNLTRAVPLLEQFRDYTSGGYHGYYGVAYDSVNTVYALLGLVGAGTISAANLAKSISYLGSLQVASGPNQGSFNMTNAIRNSSFQSLAPDPISQTAAVLLILRAAGLTRASQSVAFALSFLEAQSAQNAAHSLFNNQTFASAMSALAFQAFNDTSYAQSAKSFLISLQNRDGGFSDKTRFGYPTSNALDTAWALIALQTVTPSPISTPLPEGLYFSLTLLGVLLLIVTVRLRHHPARKIF